MNPLTSHERTPHEVRRQMEGRIAALCDRTLELTLWQLNGASDEDSRLVRAMLLTEYGQRHGGHALDAKLDELGL
mgnify:CR=1 FL=1